MAVQMSKRRFNVNEYHRMGEAGIFDEDSNVELLDGIVYEMHPPRKHKFTVEEYYQLTKAGILSEDDRVELIEGEVVEMSPIGSNHAACVNRLVALFSRNIGQSAILSVQNPMDLGVHIELQPDVALLRPRKDFYATGHPVAGDALLVIEVSDTTLRKDRRVKLPLYAKAGVPEVWLVDLKNEVIEVYTQPENGQYKAFVGAQRGETIVAREVPGLSVKVDEIIG